MVHTKSPKEVFKKRLLELSHKKPDMLSRGITTRYNYPALAPIIAKWFDEEIRKRKVRPDLQGNKVFTILASNLYKFLQIATIPQSLRKALRNYGYKIRIYRGEAVITNFIPK